MSKWTVPRCSCAHREKGSRLMNTSTQWHLLEEEAKRYEKIRVAAILGPVAQALVESAGIRPGNIVIDIGCGTGPAARAAAGYANESGRVIGVDINPAMLAVADAARDVPGAPVEWHQQNAEALSFNNETFDVALCSHSLPFMADPERVLAEAYRVLKPGGRIAVSAWCSVRDNPYFDALIEAQKEHIGESTAEELRKAFLFSERHVIGEMLTAAGFHVQEDDTRRINLNLPPMDEFVPRYMSATTAAEGFASAAVEAQQAAASVVAERLAGYQADIGLRLPFCFHIVIGVK